MLKSFGKIKFEHEDYEIVDKDNKKLNYIPIKRINLFIGKNNSGKSRLFRRILNARAGEIMLGFNDKISPIFEYETSILQNADINLEKFHGDTHPNTIKKNNYLFTWLQLVEMRAYREGIKKQKARTNPPDADQNWRIKREVFKQSGLKNNGALDYLDDMPELSPRALYIPILRGLRPIIGGADPAYTKRTGFDYFNHAPEEKTKFSDYRINSIPKNIFLNGIHTGENLYEVLRAHLLGEPDERGRIKEYEALLARTFFSDNEVTLIPKINQDVVYIKIGKDEQYPIYELGDGLQQCLIITFACFFETTPSFVFIEEPEISMHPSYLENLIEFLRINTEHIYFFTTHSNHLLDMVDTRDDVKAFKCIKLYPTEKDSIFSVSEISKDRSLLIDLGVRASSLFMANCTLWVEGITDRLYLRAFLKRYIKENKLYNYIENYHFAFVEYQGGNLVHWEFDDCEENENHILENMKALNSSIHPFLLADGDIVRKGARKEKYNEYLSENFLILACKEIENLLPKEIVTKTSEKLYSGFNRKKYKTDINKLSNMLDYATYSRDGVNGMGYFIDTALGLKLAKGEKCNRIFSADSGTLKDKKDFCTISVGIMEDSSEWELTPSIVALCKRIYSHIERHNPRLKNGM